MRFFVGLAIGLLAKGPLALVIALPPVAGWILLTSQWRRSWKSLPWITGTLLMLALALPWYLAAENKTPGFLDYFIVGEHWKRFTVRGWKGDLYGNAHSKTPGTIWLYLLLVTFPWCLGFFAVPFRRWRNVQKWAAGRRGPRACTGCCGRCGRSCSSLRRATSSPPIRFPRCRRWPCCWRDCRSESSAGSSHGDASTRFIRRSSALGVGAAVVRGISASLIRAQPFAPKSSERELVEVFHAEQERGPPAVFRRPPLLRRVLLRRRSRRPPPPPRYSPNRLDAPGRLFLAATTRYFDRAAAACPTPVHPAHALGTTAESLPRACRHRRR